MKYFTLGYMCDNPGHCGVVQKGYNSLKVVKGKSVEQVRKDYAGSCGFKPENQNFIVEEVKNDASKQKGVKE